MIYLIMKAQKKYNYPKDKILKKKSYPNKRKHDKLSDEENSQKKIIYPKDEKFRKKGW